MIRLSKYADRVDGVSLKPSGQILRPLRRMNRTLGLPVDRLNLTMILDNTGGPGLNLWFRFNTVNFILSLDVISPIHD